MAFLLWLVTLPVLGPPGLVHWLARTTAGEAAHQWLDEGRVRGELLELQYRYDAGHVREDEYDEQERLLLEQLQAIREALLAKEE